LSISFSLWLNAHVEGSILAVVSKYLSKLFSPRHWEILLLVSFFISIYYLIKNKYKNAQSWLLVFLSLFIASVIAFVLKVILARARPELLLHQHIYGFEWFSLQHKYQSTPSGHAVLAFAGLLSIAYLLKKPIYSYLAIILAVLISCSRVITLDHYLGDIIAGGYIGIFSYLWSRFILEKVNQRFIS
jgi:membrane-associated phospholipid phosphatase